MHVKALLIAAISALVVAQDIDLEAIGEELGLTPEQISVGGVLASVLPPDQLADLADPGFQSSVANEIEAGNPPSWYSELPSDVQSYLDNPVPLTAGDAVASVEGVASSLLSSASDALSSATGALDSALSSASESAMDSAMTSSDDGSSDSAETDGSSGASSTSTAGAPVPTGAVMAGLAGVAGVLALAIGL